MTIPHEAKVDVAPQFYRAAWGTREGTVLFINASRTWFLDLEVREANGAAFPVLTPGFGRFPNNSSSM
jgi:hypothetical protein